MADRVGQQLGNYQLVKLLGQGGFAEVYLGEHRYLKSHAALKVLHTALKDKQAEQFLAEAQTLVRLVHPNIVRVLDFTIEQGTPVLVMDYAPEGTLRDQHPAGTCLPLATVVSYVTQVATALQYAHNHNLIHRDVKPENMLLGPAHNVLLSDFGLALFAPSPELLSRQEMHGTIPYMAPEQLQGHPCFASDQYALGIVAYEWLCGRRPFAGSSWHLIHQHVYAAPPPLREFNPAVPASVEAVVLRALAKDPRDRYVSVQAFALALERAHGETVPGNGDDSQITVSLKGLPRSSFALSAPHTPTDTESPQRIFLVASPADEAVAARLKDDVEARGIIVWNERLRNTPNALDQGDGLRQEIRAASLMLLLLSPHTRSSSTVTESIRIANLYERRMVFVWVAGEEVAALLPLSQTWGTTAVVDVIDAREASYERALAKIIACLGEETTLTAPLQPALAESGDQTQPLHPPPATARVPTPLHAAPASTRYGGRVPQIPTRERTQTEQTVSSTKDVNRKRLLAKVRAFWITGVLERSLHGAALIALGLHEQPGAVTNPWHLVLTSPDEPDHGLPPGTPIAQVYDDAVGELLILGQPGSGKTTLLLELARVLLDRASQDESHPMPVVFNLSSWATERQPLTEWLVVELNSKYQVPRKLAQSWVDADQILPLLDGLDEVAPTYRAACVEAINIYRLSHGLVPTVVCSRSAEYLAQMVHVLLRNAVVVQPLTTQQIDTYLSSAGRQLESLRAALHTDPALQELATTPLVLSVLTLAYHGKPVAELLAAPSPETQRRQVFEAYVTRVLEHRGADTRYTPQQTLHWLSYLARQMTRQSQTVFYIERLQPDWLSEGRLRRAYQRLAVSFPSGLIGALVGVLVCSLLYPFITIQSFGGLIGGLIGVLLGREQTAIHPAETIAWSWRSFWRSLIKVRHLRIGLVFGLVAGLTEGLVFGLVFRPPGGLVFGLINGLSIGLIFGLIGVLLGREQTAIHPAETIAWSWRSFWRSLIKVRHLRIGLVVGLVSALVIGLPVGLIVGLPGGLIDGLVTGLIFGLIGVLLGREQTVIHPAETIVWSWQSVWRSLINIRHLRNTLLVGLVVGLIYGLIVELIDGLIVGLRRGLIYGLIFGLSYGLLIGLFGGLSSDTLSEHQRVKPNQGIWLSARNSVVIGLVSGLMGGLISGLISELIGGLAFELIIGRSSGQSFVVASGLSSGQSFVVASGLSFGLAGGLLSGLLNGGRACIQHVVLRWLLWRAGYAPWNYPRFLDYAAERILLRKVGGGYIFVHRLLLEYFASLGDTSVPPGSQ